MTLARSKHRSTPFLALRAGLVASALTATAAAAPQVWGEQVGSSAVDVLYGVAADGLGGSYECGAFGGDIDGPDLTPGDAFVTRRDASGNALWTKLVATSGDDGGLCVAPDAVGGVFLAGVQNGWLDIHWSNQYEAFVARFDAAGNLLWQVTLGLADYEQVGSCAPDGAGGVFVAGWTYRDKAAAAFQLGDLWLARIDAAGNVLWVDQFGNTAYQGVSRAEADGSGGVLLCGSTNGALAGPPTGTYDAWFARYDAAGNQLFLQQFGFAGASTWASGLTLADAGGFFLAGASAGVPFLSRFDALGSALWSVNLGSSGQATDVAADGLGGAYVLGGAQSDELATNAGLTDAWLRRVDASGNVQQSLQFGSKGSEFSRELVRVGSSVIAGGFSFSGGAPFGPLSRKGWVASFEDCDFDSSTNYCASSPNSSGKPALIGRTGSVRVSNNDLALFARDCATFETGIFLLADAQNNLPFGGGTLCVGGTVQRLGGVSTGSGLAELALDMTDAGSPAAQITPGSTWNFQFWFRDSKAGAGAFNLSNGLSATFCP